METKRTLADVGIYVGILANAFANVNDHLITSFGAEICVDEKRQEPKI